MRRPVVVKHNFPSSSRSHSSGPTTGRRDQVLTWTQAPFPSYGDVFRERGGSVKGARFWRGWRTLDRSLAFPTIQSQGKGPGSQGAGPLAEYEAAPHARLSAPLPGGLDHLRVVQTVASLSFRTSRSTSSASHPHLHWSVARPASIRILAAFLGQRAR